jgi:oligoendopeptidase F
VNGLPRTRVLSQYAYYLDVLLRNRSHTRSAEVEEVLAQMGELAGAPSSIFGVLNNTDMEFGTIKDEEGNDVACRMGAMGNTSKVTIVVCAKIPSTPSTKASPPIATRWR